MSLYRPPTRVTTKQTPWQAVVQEADPSWAHGKYWEIEYITSKRTFYGNPYQRGLYNRRSNVYPVGAAYGGLDALIIDNLAPTVGNLVPGLYEEVFNPAGSAAPSSFEAFQDDAFQDNAFQTS